MYGQESDGQTTEGASRRADIPSTEDRAEVKKQAVSYPYNYFYPGYMMPHSVTPYFHYTPVNYVRNIFIIVPSLKTAWSN